MTVVLLPRQYGPKAPSHIARRVVNRRRPLATVFTLPARNDVYAYNLYVAACEIDETDIPAGMALYERAIALDPKLSLAVTNLGNCHFRQHRVEIARQHYERALAIDPRQPEALYNLGYLTLNGGDVKAAIPLLQAAVESDPAFADAWFNLGMAHEQRLGTHRSPIVRLCFQRYLRLAGNDASSYAEMARRRLA